MKTLQNRLEALEASLLRPARKPDPEAAAALFARLDAIRARLSGSLDVERASIAELVATGHHDAAMSRATEQGPEHASLIMRLILDYGRHQQKDHQSNQ